MNNAIVFFTDEEPDLEVLGKRRHWFGKPSMRGYRISSQVPRNIHDEGIYGSHGIGIHNPKIDDLISKHPEFAPLMKKIYEATQHPTVQTDLIARFKRND